MIIRTQAYPRAALIGNPSDGYFGKTIAFTFDNFRAETTLFESPELEIQPSRRDGSLFESLDALADDVRLFGYYGGIRLIKAALKCFHAYCREKGIQLHDRNFTIRYCSNIPNLVGLAGSSAIITSCMRAVMAFYGVQIPKPQLANLIRDVENRELGIAAGLQDRVAQVYQGLVYMDFNRELMERQGYGRYESLDPSLMPPLYIAYRTDLSEGSEVFHNNIRERFQRGDSEVVEAMRAWAELTDKAREALEARDYERLGRMMDENFDRRARLYRLCEGNLRMVQVAREAGASAKFPGSGGAIVGIYPDEAVFERLKERLGAMQVEVIRPRLV
ncbi:MAG: GHMP kinase [Lentisphaerae bacterium]|jgi:glucuronokinase|nr:GHMP kinase [Lentisphaerota bacterium]